MRRVPILVLLLAALAGCAAPQVDETGRWLRTELYFAIARAGEGDASALARWQRFLDEEVTSRFPDGFTVLEGYGQWRRPGGTDVGRLDSRVLVILHPDDADARERVEAIRRVWKAQTGQQSVLRATQPADVSF